MHVLSLFDKVLGSIAGLAAGDALGLPTEMLTRVTIADWYGEITGLRSIDCRHPHHKLPLGSVSDDTDQALILAELLIDEGQVRPELLGERLLAWSQTERVTANRFIGRATRQALAALNAGVPPAEAGKGETIGAAMRIAPVGLVFVEDSVLIDQVAAACMPTHYTSAAISGAMAVAFGVRAALLADATPETVCAAAARGAEAGMGCGTWSWCPPLHQRIAWATETAHSMDLPRAAAFIYEAIGVGEAPWELVTAACVLLQAAGGQPMPAILAAANLGGDTDTLGAIVGALAGALAGANALDQDVLQTVQSTNQLDFARVARGLIARRVAR